MKRLSWMAVSALVTGVTLGCGNGKARPEPQADGSAGAGGTAGDASKGSGGATGSGGTGGTGVNPTDKTPPKFAGITKIVDGESGEVVVSWDPATDDLTTAARMTYAVYRAAAVGAENYTTTRHCGDPLPDAGAIEQADATCLVVAPSGSTSAVVRDVIPGRAFYYVARAFDEAGNHDANTKEVGYTTADTIAPDFGGVRSVTALSPTSVQVDWGAAYDLGTPDSELKFAVYVSSSGAPNPDSDTPVTTTKAGVHTAVVTGLDPETTYSVLVRALDAGGNRDKNTRVIKVETPEGIPPAFNGVGRADAQGTTVRLFWLPATDNVTDPDNLLYDVYQSLVPHGQNFSRVSFTSNAGASSIVIPNQQQGTAYYYVVRARDAAGNRDSNIKEVQATTDLIDKTPPTFGGVQAVGGDTPGTLLVTWSPAQDDNSTQAQITYEAYVSSTSQLPLDPAAAPTASVVGTTSLRIAGLAPGTTQFVVIRAKDAAGNLNTKSDTEKSGATLAAVGGGDIIAPVTPSAPTVTQVLNPATKLTVSWAAATDAAGAANIRYHLCASPVQADCVGAKFATHIVATTAYGVTTATLSLLLPRTPYNVYVRAEDNSGNLETADHGVVVSTATSYKTNVEPVLFDRCIACHDTYDKPSFIVSVASSFVEDAACAAGPVALLKDGSGTCALKLIEPGYPEYSYIYRKIDPLNLATPPFTATVPCNYDGLQMPRDSSAKLTGDENDIIRTWIEQGADAN